MLDLPPVYPITDHDLSGLSHPMQVKALADAGCRLVQIRAKKESSKSFYDALVESLEITRNVGAKLIVNDRVDLAMAAGADGVHLGQDDLPPERARRLLGDSAIIGFSTHSIEQAIAAASMGVDYIAIGPIFSTTTKENPDPVVGLDGLKRVREAVPDIALVAIGGITAANIADVITSGANSAAIISSLFTNATTIGECYSELLRCANVQH